jgi:hypothetical protein
MSVEQIAERLLRLIGRCSRHGSAVMRLRSQLANAPVLFVSSSSMPPNQELQRTTNSSLQLTMAAAWRHTTSAGSGPVSAVAGR